LPVHGKAITNQGGKINLGAEHRLPSACLLHSLQSRCAIAPFCSLPSGVGRPIEDGHYGRRLHRMRRIYAKRPTRLLQILRSDFANIVKPPEFASWFPRWCRFCSSKFYFLRRSTSLRSKSFSVALTCSNASLSSIKPSRSRLQVSCIRLKFAFARSVK